MPFQRRFWTPKSTTVFYGEVFKRLFSHKRICYDDGNDFRLIEI